MRKLKWFITILTVVIVMIISFLTSNPFIGSWKAIEIDEDGSETVWAEVLLFEKNDELYIHSNVVGEKSGNPLEKNVYNVNRLKRSLTLVTSFGMTENYKYSFIDKDTFILDKEFINLKFIRIEQEEVDKYLVRNDG